MLKKIAFVNRFLFEILRFSVKIKRKALKKPALKFKQPQIKIYPMIIVLLYFETRRSVLYEIYYEQPTIVA